MRPREERASFQRGIHAGSCGRARLGPGGGGPELRSRGAGLQPQPGPPQGFEFLLLGLGFCASHSRLALGTFNTVVQCLGKYL